MTDPKILFIGGHKHGQIEHCPLSPMLHFRGPEEPPKSLPGPSATTDSPSWNLVSYVPMKVKVGNSHMYVYVLIGIQEADIMELIINAIINNKLEPRKI